MGFRKQEQTAGSKSPKLKTCLEKRATLAASLWLKGSLPGRQGRKLGTNTSELGALPGAQKVPKTEATEVAKVVGQTDIPRRNNFEAAPQIPSRNQGLPLAQHTLQCCSGGEEPPRALGAHQAALSPPPALREGASPSLPDLNASYTRALP